MTRTTTWCFYEEEPDHAAPISSPQALQVLKDKLVLTTGGLETDHRGLLSVDEHGMTTVPGGLAAGDVVNGLKPTSSMPCSRRRSPSKA